MDAKENAGPIAATPEQIAPIVIPLPSAPARIRTTPLIFGQATLLAQHKARRPGVIVLPTLTTRVGETPSYATLDLVRPNVVPAGVCELRLAAAVNATLDVRHQRRERTLYTRLPFDNDEDDAPTDETTYVDGDWYEAIDPEDDFAERSILRAPTADRAITIRLSRAALPGFFPGQFERRQVLAPSAHWRDGLPDAAQLYALSSRREIWLRLENNNRDFDAVETDVALFTLAPVIFNCDIDPPDRLFMVRLTDGDDEPGNFGTIGAVNAVAAAMGLPVTLLDPGGLDIWAQDAVHLGYVRDPDQTVDVVVQTARRGQRLHNVIDDYLADDTTGLFTQLFDASDDEHNNFLDYGGNVVVTPPVTHATALAVANGAGPAVQAHPIAPYGKILIGDGGDGGRRPTRHHWQFFHNQQVQPVVPIDTSWLSIAHVDEIISFAMAPDTCDVTHCGARGFALMLAAPDLFVQILQGVRAQFDIDPARVRRGFRSSPRAFRAFAGDNTLQGYTLDGGAAAPVSRVAHTWARKLDLIRARLIHTLDLNGDGRDILPVPTLFSPGNANCHSATPDMVNLIALGTTLVIPKPWGPRVPVAVARTVLTGLHGGLLTGAMVDAANLANFTEELFWARPDITAQEVTDAFTNAGVQDITQMAQGGANAVPGWGELPAGWPTVPADWRQYRIRQNTVDIFEAYMIVRLAKLGLEARFVDDWLYHLASGDLHCGSKVKRLPHVVADENEWWRRTDYHLPEPTW